MKRGTKKGLIIGTLLAVGMFVFSETMFYLSLREPMRWVDIVLFAIFWLICVPMTVGVFNQDERGKLIAANNLLVGEYEITYTIKCTYRKNALNSEDALEDVKPFNQLTWNEVKVLEYKANYVGETNGDL